MSKILAGILSVLVLFSVPFVFAEIPTPYNEWDFDLKNVDVVQNPFDLEKLDISITILYKGELLEGTVNVYANVTNPNNYSHKLFGQLRDMTTGETQTINLTSNLPMDGKYKVDVSLSPPEKPYLDHIFDTENITYTIDINGREKHVESVGDYSELMISYSLKDYKNVKYNEMVHAVITLPDNHMFEKIAVVNGKFTREMSIDTEDIYVNSVAPFKDLKVKLVKEGNLLPLADAQDTMQEYVKFYSNDKELCTKVFCVNIDLADDPEMFPLWLLAAIPIAGGFLYYIIKTRPAPYSSNLTGHADTSHDSMIPKNKPTITDVKSPKITDYIKNHLVQFVLTIVGGVLVTIITQFF